MKLLSRIIGTLFIIIACFFLMLGLISWPPGGLMFALPYIFFMFALGFSLAGALMFLVGRKKKKRTSMTRRLGKEAV